MPKKIEIPEGVQNAIKEYGFNDSVSVEKAIAVRKTSSWFAILFREEHSESFFAVDFVMGADGWEVSNDWVGPFDTVKEFETERLTTTIL